MPGRLEDEKLFRLLDRKGSLHGRDEAAANTPTNPDRELRTNLNRNGDELQQVGQHMQTKLNMPFI